MKMDSKQVRGLIALLAVLVLAVGGYFVAAGLEDRQKAEDQVTDAEGFGELPTIRRGEEVWRRKSAVHTILVIGYDKDSDEELIGQRGGGLADSLVLLVVNDREKTVRQLWIDRNTIVPVHTRGLTGRDTGHKPMQICIAHAYGNTVDLNDRNTVEAVETLLPGLKVDDYISLGMDFIPAFNKLVGGVTVTIEDDFTAYDPAMAPGVTLKLNDEQAYRFCRSRMTIGDGQNTSRMRRQRTYVTAATKTIREGIQSDGNYASRLVYGVESITNTSMNRGHIINEMNRAMTYRLVTAEGLPYTDAVVDALREVYVDEADSANWVLDALYDRIS